MSNWSDIPYGERIKLLEYYDKWVETGKRKWEKKVRWPGYNTGTLKRRLREFRKTLEEDLEDAEEHTVEQDSINHQTVTARPDRIVTVEQLLELMEIDLEEWAITKIQGNKWEGYRKNKKVVWEVEDGVVKKGSIEDMGDLFIAPLIQVKVWLVRREPVPINPVVEPVNIILPELPLEDPPIDARIKNALVVSDPHFGFSRSVYDNELEPFHDRRALSILLQFAQTYTFDAIVILGDLLDLPEWSDRFFRGPEYRHVTQPALIEAAWWMGQLRMAQPYADMFLIQGNHDLRMDRKIATHFVDGYDLRAVDELHLPPAWSVPKLLGLHNLGIEWVGDYPRGKVWLNDNLIVEHGSVVSGVPGGTAKKIAEKRAYSTVFGHIHRPELTIRQVRERSGNRVVYALCPGFLGHMDGRVPGHNENQEWGQGFAVVSYTLDGEVGMPHIVMIEEGRAIFDNSMWESDEEEVIELLMEAHGQHLGS